MWLVCHENGYLVSSDTPPLFLLWIWSSGCSDNRPESPQSEEETECERRLKADKHRGVMEKQRSSLMVAAAAASASAATFLSAVLESKWLKETFREKPGNFKAHHRVRWTLTVPFGLETAEQVVAGLLQQHVVVSLIGAVWVVVVTQTAESVHWNAQEQQSGLRPAQSLSMCAEADWRGIRVLRRPPCTPGSPSEPSRSPEVYRNWWWRGSPDPTRPVDDTSKVWHLKLLGFSKQRPWVSLWSINDLCLTSRRAACPLTCLSLLSFIICPIWNSTKFMKTDLVKKSRA